MSLVLHDEMPLFKMTNVNYGKRKIEEEEDTQNTEHTKKSFASWLSKNMSNKKIDDYLEVFNVFVSIGVYGQFVVSTYHDVACPPNLTVCGTHRLPRFLQISEIVLMIIIGVDFLLFFLISENRIAYIFSYQYGLITYMTIIPTLLVRFEIVVDQDIIDLYYLNFWKIFRVFSVGRLLKVFTRRNWPMARVVFKVVFTLILIILNQDRRT